jgi:fibronectin type 3 domain-containing protein
MRKTISFRLITVLLCFVTITIWGCGGVNDVTSLIDLQAPATVKQIIATPADQRVRLAWSTNSEDDLVGYNIYRSSSSSSGFELVGSTGISQSPYFQDEGPDVNGDNLPDGLVNNMRYFYKITAFDRQGRESSQDLASVVSAVPGDLPAGQDNLEVKNVRVYGGPGITEITWDLNLNSQVYGYKIYRNELGQSSSFVAIAIVPQNTNSFSDSGLTMESEFVYRVAPITSDLAEGRQTESRAVRSMYGDSTTPKPPGHDAVNSPFTILSAGSGGVSMQWGRPTENTDGSLIPGSGGTNDLVGGGFIIYRGTSLYGSFRPVGILENIGTEITYSYTDPYGTTSHYYYVKAFDNSGNLSSVSAVIAANLTVQVPKMVQDVDAFASVTEGAIKITWTLESSATSGYRIYRSENRDYGYQPLSGVMPATLNWYTDAGSGLSLGETYWYKVSGVSTTSGGEMLEGSPSTSAPATPGPSDGVFYLEAEDATIVQYSSSTDWQALSRQAFPDPFHGRGALYMYPSSTAVPGTAFATLQWSMEIDAAGPGGSVHTYDVYMSVVRNSSAGIFDLFIQEPVAGTSVISRNGFDFYRSSFGYPPQNELIFLGQLNFVDADFVGGSPTNETINCRVGYQGANPAVAAGNGELFFDGLVLVRK